MSAHNESHLEVEVSYAGRERIDDVKPLWLQLLRHHAEAAAHLGEVKPPEESWALRRARYEEWLREPDAFLCIVESAGEAIGYAMVHMRDGDHTFVSGDRIAAVETICVVSDSRGLGAGAALVDGLRRKGYELGIHEARATHLVGNNIARDFFEALGGKPIAVTYAVPIEPPDNDRLG